MQSFTLYTPTEIVFGKGAELKVADEIKKWGGTKVLVVYGGGSVVKSGLLSRIENVLTEAGIPYALFGGVQPNPRLAHAEKGVQVAFEEQVDFVLAVGGGSVIDTAKAIAHGTARPECKLWDLWMKKEPLGKSLPIGAVLTIAAAGSETSGSAVLTNEEINRKDSISTELNRPKFAIMNPELTFTLPKYQIGCGVVDIMMHTLERYFIPEQKNQMTDEIAEALLRVTVENGRKAMKNSYDYDAMSEIMWCGSLSHNDITGLGRGAKDFSVHKFGHALSMKYDYAHGATLSAVWGSWAEYIYEADVDRFAHYAEKVWGVQMEDKEAAAKEGIRRTVEYFKEIGMPTTLKELGLENISDEELMVLAMDATKNGTTKLAVIKQLDLDDVLQIFKNSR
mgnify:CR=1 FL=1